MVRHEITRINPTDGQAFLDLIKQATVLRAESRQLDREKTVLQSQLLAEKEPSNADYVQIAKGLRGTELQGQLTYSRYLATTSLAVIKANRLSGGLVTVACLDSGSQPITALEGLPYQEHITGYVSAAHGQISNRAGLELFSDNLDLKIMAKPQLFRQPQSFRVPLFSDNGDQIVSVAFNK